MRSQRLPLLLLTIALIGSGASPAVHTTQETILSYIADPQKQDIQLYWKDDSSRIIGSLGRLNEYLGTKNQQLLFATNGGMYQVDQFPVGLFIQQGKTIRPINRATGEGNFYLQPNGIFYITNDKKAVICTTGDYIPQAGIAFATQSGPMLLVHGKINTIFKEGSANLNIRNGVGLMPGNKLLFAMSKEPVNFYDFASYFKQQGCTEALYLDGFVSRAWLPEQSWTQTDGNFGVLIGVTRSRSARPASR